MASVTTNFHFYQDPTLPVKVDVREDGDYWVTVGEYPHSVTMFLTAAQAETLRLAIVVALEERSRAVTHRAVRPYYDDPNLVGEHND